jgi:hypothetical protein
MRPVQSAGLEVLDRIFWQRVELPRRAADPVPPGTISERDLSAASTTETSATSVEQPAAANPYSVTAARQHTDRRDRYSLRQAFAASSLKPFLRCGVGCWGSPTR